MTLAVIMGLGGAHRGLWRSSWAAWRSSWAAWRSSWGWVALIVGCGAHHGLRGGRLTVRCTLQKSTLLAKGKTSNTTLFFVPNDRSEDARDE